MEFRFLLIFVLLSFLLKGGDASQLPAEMYWQSMLPNTNMPKALHDLIQPGNKTAFSDVVIGLAVASRDDYGVGYIGKISLEDTELATSTTVYFLNNDLIPGKKMFLVFTKSTNNSNFLPRKISETIPFSSNKYPEILNYFSLNPTSKQARIMKRTIEVCEAPSVRSEEKFCATSLESLVYSVVSKYGNKVRVLANEAEEEYKKQNFTILKGIEMIGDDQIVCHQKRYKYAVYYCHIIKETKAYLVPLVGENGSKAKALVVCHTNTSTWNPMHVAFQVLKVKPGGPTVCHFLNSDAIVWLPN